jgi:hypothetical protein
MTVPMGIPVDGHVDNSTQLRLISLSDMLEADEVSVVVRNISGSLNMGCVRGNRDSS